MFIHIGDAHLKPTTWTSWAAVQGDAYKAVDKVIDYIHEKQVKILVLSGDVFDGLKVYSTDIESVKSLCSSVNHVLYIPGNHDNAKPPVLSTFPNATMLTPDTPVIIDDAAFVGVPYTPHRQQLLDSLGVIRKTLEEVPQKVLYKYVVLHTSMQHLIGFEGSWRLNLADIENILPAGTMVLVGDIHVRDTRDCNGGQVHSSGPLYPQDWGQTGRGCYVDLIDGADIQALPVQVRQYYNIRVTDTGGLAELEADLTEVRSRVKSGMLPPAVKVLLPVGSLIPVPHDRYPDILITEAMSGDRPDMETGAVDTSEVSVEAAVRAELPEDSVEEFMAIMRSDNPKKHVLTMLTEAGVKTNKM